MKVGDLVQATFPLSLESYNPGIGIIIDSYGHDDGISYFEVQWKEERNWHAKEELRLFNEVS